MPTSLQIKKMSRVEKLRAMEDLWTDLIGDESQVPSPAWHKKVLADTEARIKAGSETFAPWDEAKKNLLRRAR